MLQVTWANHVPVGGTEQQGAEYQHVQGPMKEFHFWHSPGRYSTLKILLVLESVFIYNVSIYGPVARDSRHAGAANPAIRALSTVTSIAKAIRATSNDALDIEFGSLYPALKRLELKGWIASRWEVSEFNRKAKVYRLTPAGRKQLHEEHSKWAGFARAVGLIMGSPPGESET